MSTEQNTDPTPTPPEDVPTLSAGSPIDGTTPDPQEGGAGPNREAAQRRRQLRQVEAERDGLRSQVEAFQRAEVERRAAEYLTDPADVWHATSLDALRADDGGALDTEKVTAELARVTEEHPHWRKPHAHLHQGATRGEAEVSGPSFGESFRKALRAAEPPPGAVSSAGWMRCPVGSASTPHSAERTAVDQSVAVTPT